MKLDNDTDNLPVVKVQFELHEWKIIKSILKTVSGQGLISEAEQDDAQWLLYHFETLPEQD